MTIAAEKISETAFYDVLGIIESYPWLRRTMDSLLELWNMCDVRGQQDLIRDLFGRFTYLNIDQLEDASKKIVDQVEAWGFEPGNTYFTVTADPTEDGVDGSAAGLQFMKNKFPPVDGWKESYFYPSIAIAANKVKQNDNLLLFDDFIGSGNTINRKISYVLKTLKKRGIKLNALKVISYAAMEFGVESIRVQSDVEVYCPFLLKKGLTDFESPESLEAKKTLMRDLESKLGKRFKGLRLSGHSLGYGESEALFQIQGYNCPNNLFPIFWWPIFDDGQPRKTIFVRSR